MAMIQEAQTEHIYRQKRPGDAEWCQRTFGFDPDTADQITRLADGHHFFKYGPHPETLVRHTRSRWEESITNTDEAFLAAAAADAEHVHYTKYWEPAQAVVAGLGSGSRGAAAYPLVQPYM